MPINLLTGDLATPVPFSTGMVPGFPPQQVFLHGRDDTGTDEYDSTIVGHELAHSLEFYSSRESPRRANGLGGIALNPRLAFAEGFGNAVGTLASGNRQLINTTLPNLMSNFPIDSEMGTAIRGGLPVPLAAYKPVAGGYNEYSISEILFDIADPANDDNLALGWGLARIIRRDVHRGSSRTRDDPGLLDELLFFWGGARRSARSSCVSRSQLLRRSQSPWIRLAL